MEELAGERAEEGRHLPVELLGLLAHVDDVVLAEHLAGVGVVPAGPAQGLACSTQCREGGKLGRPPGHHPTGWQNYGAVSEELLIEHRVFVSLGGVNSAWLLAAAAVLTLRDRTSSRRVGANLFFQCSICLAVSYIRHGMVHGAL